MPNLGEKELPAITDEEWLPIDLTFQCADVRRTLAAVSKMTKKGCTVVFDEEESYILHKKSGKRMRMYEKDGTYRMKIWVAPSKEARDQMDFHRQGKKP